jgi:hypothetical protein
LLHFLAGLREPRELATWARRGASFEGQVIEEVVALAHDDRVRPEVYFWGPRPARKSICSWDTIARREMELPW